MLAISPLQNTRCHGGGRGGGARKVLAENNYAGAVAVIGDDKFSDAFAGGSFLEDIDFDDLFVGFEDGDEVLPDLEIDSNELFGELPGEGAAEESDLTTPSEAVVRSGEDAHKSEEGIKGREVDDNGGLDQTVPETPEEDGQQLTSNSSTANSPSAATSGTGKGGKTAGGSSAKTTQGKRKVKVDWTPELHRRFVQAVEQLGIDKAVPSRILEIMGIDCLTRHNVASHLQKYRSHRKHLLAREAEAASWSQRRHVYGGGVGHKRDRTAPWMAPTIGFPSPPPPVQPFPRPLHVWGHPTVDHAMMHMWPKHLLPSRPPPPHQWAAQHPEPSSFWHHHPRYLRGNTEGWMPNAPTKGTPCYPHHQTLPPQTRFASPPMQGVPPPPPASQPMSRPDSSIPLPAKQLQLDLHPSKESVDAAIGDVLSKPWLPLPLGLKPPSVDSVLVELQRQGVAKVPPSCA